jgi:ankyrin repeat protein
MLRSCFVFGFSLVGDCVLRTPLFCAAGNGHVDTVKHLLATGANVNAVDSVGRTALHWWVVCIVSRNL